VQPSSILLTDKVAIITGGAGGIGEGVSLTFARFGADVVVADVDAAGAEGMASRVRNLGRRALAVPTDVRDRSAVREMVARTVGELGGVDVLVNLAGGVRQQPFLAMSERSRDRHVELNFEGLFGPTHAAVRAMIDGRRRGSVINIASIEGQRAAPNFAVYAACKAGMLNFTRSLALELAEHGIRVNAVAPDQVEPPGVVGSQAAPPLPGSAAPRARGIPLQRLGTTDDIGAACVFLASDMAAYITGITLNVDGGTWAAGGWFRGSDGTWKLSG
jgi:NAD(P)-dependent dehydrogenase (short-subunit alcohol dehydrogenase family)